MQDKVSWAKAGIAGLWSILFTSLATLVPAVFQVGIANWDWELFPQVYEESWLLFVIVAGVISILVIALYKFTLPTIAFGLGSIALLLILASDKSSSVGASIHNYIDSNYNISYISTAFTLVAFLLGFIAIYRTKALSDKVESREDEVAVPGTPLIEDSEAEVVEEEKIEEEIPEGLTSESEKPEEAENSQVEITEVKIPEEKTPQIVTPEKKIQEEEPPKDVVPEKEKPEEGENPPVEIPAAEVPEEKTRQPITPAEELPKDAVPETEKTEEETPRTVAFKAEDIDKNNPYLKALVEEINDGEMLGGGASGSETTEDKKSGED